MAYQPIIAPTDLDNRLYPEIRTLITRSNNDIAVRAITAAITEVKMYLGKYDLAAMFGDQDSDTGITYTDQFLSDMVTTVAIWNLLQLSNVEVNLEVANTRYEQTISSLKKIQAGMADPDGWPLRDTTGSTRPNGSAVYYTTRPRRNNYF